MRIAVVLVALLALSGCSSPPPETSLSQPSQPQPACPEPRPQVCTMEFNPVCGELLAGGYREYSSPCNACADDAVVDFSDVDIVGSPTFSRLLELRSVLRQSGHRLVLCNEDPATRSVFATAELDRLFDFAESESAALTTLRANG